MNYIWATRGKTWGFRLLRTGGISNPLEVYEAAFAGTDNAEEVLQRRAGMIAVRFPDPQRRTDRAGRVIPHDFVLLTDEVKLENIDSARTELWPKVALSYATVWEEPTGPLPDM